MWKFVCIAIFYTTSLWAQAQAPLKGDHPEHYRVVAGDTLWDISERFLTKPWHWKELWYANPQIAQPDLIYPGDRLSLVYIQGQPRLMLSDRGAGNTIRLSPQVRPVPQVIPTIPLEHVLNFLSIHRIIDSQKIFEEAPYVIGGAGEGVIFGAGNTIYARGTFADAPSIFRIFRQGKVYQDPVTKEFLGINANKVGAANLREYTEKTATLYLSSASSEVRRGDVLLDNLEVSIPAAFVPSAPEHPIEGVIIDVPHGVSIVGAMDVVTLNKGAREGLVVGSTLEIYKAPETVRDPKTEQYIGLPDKASGVLMVFRVFDKASYALVLKAHQQLAVGDKVRNPR